MTNKEPLTGWARVVDNGIGAVFILALAALLLAPVIIRTLKIVC